MPLGPRAWAELLEVGPRPSPARCAVAALPVLRPPRVLTRPRLGQLAPPPGFRVRIRPGCPSTSGTRPAAP